MHIFEAAGLGKAPYTLIGQATGGTQCDYCGTHLIHQFHLKSADGKTFVVGCDCVEKTGDRVLIGKVRRGQSLRKAAAKYTPLEIARRELLALITQNLSRLQAIPHPTSWKAEKGETFADWGLLMAKLGDPTAAIARITSTLAS